MKRIDRARVPDWESAHRGLSGLRPDFVFIALDEAERPWVCRYETFSFYEVVLVRSGAMTMWMRGRKLRGRPGDVFVVPPGVPHRELTEPGETAQLLCLAAGFRTPSGRRRRFPLPLPAQSHLEPGHAVERQMLRIASESFHRQPGYATVIDACVMQVFVELARQARGMSAPEVNLADIRRQRLVKDAMGFIEHHAAEPLSLHDLAQHFFLSPEHFVRVFKRISGHTPMAYLTQAR
ncbi:MAG: helix-turn-helix transcriptional regulator, partial [Planctomycetes bacterium]|nr:helix-turn-helix transcriptional regulator [Planctomycetota bacterium]